MSEDAAPEALAGCCCKVRRILGGLLASEALHLPMHQPISSALITHHHQLMSDGASLLNALITPQAYHIERSFCDL